VILGDLAQLTVPQTERSGIADMRQGGCLI
jgi:hypothetical protein